jgi:CBS domain containing-hemolysin-like protein
MLTVRDANRQLNLHLPEDGGYTTLAGFLLARAGRLLQEGERVEHEGLRFTIERVDKRRIRRVRFMPAAEDKPASAVTLLSVVSTSLLEPLQIAPLLF